MTVTTQEIFDFNRMTPFQKQRLKDKDPEKYNELFKESQAKFNIESDPAALAELERNPQ